MLKTNFLNTISPDSVPDGYGGIELDTESVILIFLGILCFIFLCIIIKLAIKIDDLKIENKSLQKKLKENKEK